MKVIHTKAEWMPHWHQLLEKKQRLGFVPTMGALHQGHLDLVEKSKASMDLTLVSIFVNPTQFNRPEDFQNYPITLDADLAALEAAAVDFVFVPISLYEPLICFLSPPCDCKLFTVPWYDSLTDNN